MKERFVRLQGKKTRDTNTIGEISESAITTRFLQLGYAAFTPFVRKKRYDLVIENAEGQIWRVQSTPPLMNEGACSKCSRVPVVQPEFQIL